MKRILTGIVLMALITGCAAVVTRPIAPTGRVEVYKVGQFTFRIYDDPRSLAEDVKKLKLPLFDPELLPGVAMVGNHDKATLTIFTVRDVYVLMHELKHLLESDWIHALPCGRTSCLEEAK